MTIITIVTLVVASFLNDYVLENLLFPDNTFSYINKFFTAIELIFLTFSIKVLLSFKAIGLLFKLLFTKEFKYSSPGFKKELKQVSWPIFPAMIIYGVISGVVIYLLTKGYSMVACIAQSTILSAFWGMIYWYCWRRGYLLWLYDFLYQDADDPQEPPEGYK